MNRPARAAPLGAFKLTPYNISLCAYLALALVNFLFLLVVFAKSCDAAYKQINRWDAIYHAHNLGAHICSVVVIINMWLPKPYMHNPKLSIIHFVALEIIKLYFALKWSRHWPAPESSSWLVHAVASLNVTDASGFRSPEKVSAFNELTKRFEIEWVQADPNPQVAPVWRSSAAEFLKWANSKSYDRVGALKFLAIATTALGLVACALARVDYRARRSEAKGDFVARSVPLASGPIVVNEI